MRRIIIKQQIAIKPKKTLRIEHCIRCKAKFRVNPMSLVQCQGFCSYLCQKKYRDPSIVDVNVVIKDPSRKGKNNKWKKRCLFCKKRLIKGNTVRFCDDNCKDSFNNQR